ncbi:hypothetical protein VDG1235_2307 [Verrucomicrobiia bacterium DG1235]|nr:hypothetical protein VDG1235_2307 [Verrucomicrobiae bacterium DG1235]
MEIASQLGFHDWVISKRCWSEIGRLRIVASVSTVCSAGARVSEGSRISLARFLDQLYENTVPVTDRK